MLGADATLEQQRHRRVSDLLADVIGGHQRDCPARAAEPTDDGAEDVSEFRANQQESLGVGFGRGDLQQRDDLASGREPVLGDAVVCEFQEFLVANAGQTQDLDHGERPERFLFFIGQVSPAPAGDLLGPDEVACGFRRDGSAQSPAGAGNQSSGLGVSRRLEQAGGVAAPAVGGADQDG
ncbi:hypothetical protein ACH4D3_37425 [Streptomyces sp. NPDC018026]|uniref:hypothetical protein n=1 Tax=Streptomyces sp. NPDC018026 TaxID=3365031 RepID=UPI0037AC6D60